MIKSKDKRNYKMFENMENKQATPKVGVAIILVNDDGKVLLMKRQGSHGAGCWSVPGGHLEIGESELECCTRELKEETNLDLLSLEKHTFMNDINMEEGLHYVTLYYFGEFQGELENMEPFKCKELGWFSINSLPSPLFGQIAKIFGKSND